MILSKTEFNTQSLAGRLGNYLRSWATLEELKESGYHGYLTIRSKQIHSNWFVPYAHTGRDIPGGIRCLSYELGRIVNEGGPDYRDFFYQEVPDLSVQRIMNMEMMMTTRGLYLTYEVGINRDTPVRGLRDRGLIVEGLVAHLILKTFLSPDSQEQLWEIWENHPTSIIEATEFAGNVGAFNKRLVIWEVRDY